MRAVTLLFVDQSLSRYLEKIDEDIPTSPEVIGAHTLNFRPKFKFLQLFLGVGPVGVRRPSGCLSVNFCANRFFSQTNGRIATKLAHDGLQISVHPGCAQGVLTSSGQSQTPAKIWGCSTPKGRNAVSRRMFTWVAQYAPLNFFWLWTKVHPISFPQRRTGCDWSSFLDSLMSNHSGDIRDRNRKLSEVIQFKNGAKTFMKDSKFSFTYAYAD